MTVKEFTTRTLTHSIPSTSSFEVLGTPRQLPGPQMNAAQCPPLESRGDGGADRVRAPADMALATGRVSYSDNPPPKNHLKTLGDIQ